MNILFFTFLLCQSLPESSGKSYTHSKVGRVSPVVELNSLLDGHSSRVSDEYSDDRYYRTV